MALLLQAPAKSAWSMLSALLLALPAFAQTSVFDGQRLYTGAVQFEAGVAACSSCHFANPPSNPAQGEGAGSQHPQAANHRQLIVNAFTTGGVMMNYLFAGGTTGFEGDANLASKAFKLSMYIGQYKAPAFKSGADGACADPTLAMNVRSGVIGTKNIFGCLVDDGSAGVASDTGLTASTIVGGNASAVGAAQLSGTTSVAYNVSYTSTAGYVGAGSFRVNLVNPFITDNALAAVTKTINVTVLGITSASSALGVKGRSYTAGAGALYRVTSNDGSADTFTATGLPAGLSVDAAGYIVGSTTATGDFTVTVGATTHAAVNNGPVTKDVALRIVGITNSVSVVDYEQNMGPVTFQIQTSHPASAYAITGAALPSGLTLTSGGAITGTPTLPTSVTVTLSATIGAETVTQDLTINVAAGIPGVSTTPTLVASPQVAGTVGQPFSVQINATNTPLNALNPYNATGLPPGISINRATGLVSGTPQANAANSDYPIELSASNAGGTGRLNITIRINPANAPVVSSADPTPSNVNSPIPAYQITATNPPLTAFAEVPTTPSVLQAHNLTLDTTTGLITGTPTASGIFTVSVTATNAAATSAPKLISFNILPTQVPVITSPTFVSAAAGTAITPIQVVATNPAIVSYAASALPPGLAIDTTTGVISGTPTTPGSFSATLTATNGFGPNSRVVPFTIGVPAPIACAMSVPLNTPTTLDLSSCLFNGFAPTGVSIVATAAHGTAVANGTKVTYTPVHNYFGGDAFTFVGYGAGGTSPQGTVTVTVTGRPDPTQDAVVTALIAAQTETAQRFSRAQMSNFQRRMESLHGGGADSAQGGGASLRGGAAAVRSEGFSGGTAQSAQVQVASASGAVPASQLAVAAGGPSQAANSYVFGPGSQVPAAASETEVMNAVASGLGLKSLPFSDSVFSMLKSRSLNLGGVAQGLGFNTPGNKVGNTSYWVEGVASFGTRDASGGMDGSEFNSDGISVGADRRFSDQLVVGMGVGYARDTTKIGTDGSSNKAKGYSLAVYGSYQPSKNTFVDALLGFGTLDFDTTRFVAPINDYALGQRSGRQIFGSLTGGYEFRNNEFLVSPYGRIDFASTQLRTSTESGAGAYALTYFGQTTNSVQGALGVRSEWVHAANFGYVVPRVRAEYLHEFQGNGQAFIGYADQVGGPRYALASTGTGRDSIVFGLGSDFLMRDGLTLSFEYQLSHSFSHDSSYAVRLRLTKEFDARGLPRLLGEYPVRIGKPLDIQLDGTYTMDDNVTRAKSGPDKLSDDSYAVNVSKTIVSPLSEQSRLLITGTLGGEKFHHYNGLSHLTGSVDAEVQYRDSSDFDDPTFAVFGKLTGENYETRLRDGYRLSAGVSVRQALTDRINIFGALSRNVRNANSSVFSTRDNSLRANIDYEVNDNQTLYLGAEYRRGDIVSTGRASLENVTIAKVFAQDDAYPGGQFFSYRFEGRTVLTTLGYNIALGSKDSLDFSWRRVRSTPGLRPSFVTSPRNYIDNQLSAVYLMRF